MDRGRFSLLLLEPGEIYFEDFSAELITPDTTPKTYETKKQNGRLKMCSKSLVFDPQELSKPIVKIPLKDCLIIEQWKGTAKFLKSNNVLTIKTKVYIEMLESNLIAPYQFCDSGQFLFLLRYANVLDCLRQICQLQRANSLPAVEQANMIAAIVHSRHARVGFDPLWLDLYEKVVMETEADKINPLVVNPGRILLSDCRLYFQPYNNIEKFPVLKINLDSIRRIVKRRFLLRHIGLEIYSSENNTVPHIYLSFRSQQQRDKLYERILEQPNLKLSDVEQNVMTLQWQNGIISNYEYLMYINSLGDRTINDLTQYPVFPWIIADYLSKTLDLNNPKTYRDLSKPVGALNPERLHRLIERYEEMSHPKFLYGSHYSTPGFVLFYLVRLYPHYMLCLQNGRFDHPDRMFNCMSDVYKNCLNNMSDFKELIPEFYDVDQKGKFLVNHMGINFGYRHNGLKVADVELPPWAENPEHLVITLREALESDYVSKNLHHWIDLIFGYKQRGEEALKSNNLYYYLCYEGNIDLDSIADVNQRHALEVQIMEFGQIPKQVFNVPHPQRKIGMSLVLEPSYYADETTTPDEIPALWKNLEGLILESTFSQHRDTVSSLFLTDNEKKIVSVGHDSKIKVFSLELNRQIRSANIGFMPLSSCIQLPKSNTLVIGSFDNNIILYDLDFGTITQTVPAHEDSITCMAWAEKLNLLSSGSSDCTIRLWKGFDNTGSNRHIQHLICRLDHNSHVTCLCFNSDNTYLAAGTEDGEIYIWDISTNVLHKKFPIHSAAIKGINYSPDGQKICTCGVDKVVQIMDVNTGMSLYSNLMTSPLLCLKWIEFLLFVGADDGILHIWNILEVKKITEVNCFDSPITSLTVSQDKNVIITGGNSQIKVWRPK